MTVDDGKPRKRHTLPFPAKFPIEEDLESARWLAPGLWKKAGKWVRSWLMLDSAGQARILEAGKHSIMRRTGLPARDLRILDPQLSYPSTLLGREKAIVVNLEHIKAIITAQEVFLLNSKDPVVSPFAEDLQCRLFHLHKATKNQEAKGSTDVAEGETQGKVVSLEKDSSGCPQWYKLDDKKGGGEEKQDLKNKYGAKVLPFEFIALEACLQAACGSLDKEVWSLEQVAYPTLDKLTSKISTLNLERVRQIKSGILALTGRVQKVRDELEHLLDDDEDMANMYLTDKLTQQQDIEDSSVSSTNEYDDAQLESDERTPITDIPPEDQEGSGRFEGEAAENDTGFQTASSLAVSMAPTSRASPTESAVSKCFNVEELEMLLEAYFAQIGGILNKLTALREYVDDTEDYVNIMLDDKQNHLLKMGVMLSTATLVLGAFVTVTAIMGMNINIDLFDKTKHGNKEFLMTVGGGASGTIFLYVIAIFWCKHKRLL